MRVHQRAAALQLTEETFGQETSQPGLTVVIRTPGARLIGAIEPHIASTTNNPGAPPRGCAVVHSACVGSGDP